jgi:hypothetical protein
MMNTPPPVTPPLNPILFLQAFSSLLAINRSRDQGVFTECPYDPDYKKKEFVVQDRVNSGGYLCFSKAPGNKPDPEKDQEPCTNIRPEILRCPDHAETKDDEKDPKEHRHPAGAVVRAGSGSITARVCCGFQKSRPDKTQPKTNQQARAGVTHKYANPKADK